MASILNKKVIRANQESKTDKTDKPDIIVTDNMDTKNDQVVNNENKKKHKIVFLTDHNNMTNLIKQNCIVFNPLQFVNRDLKYFEEKTDIVFINLNDSVSRNYVRTNLNGNHEYLKVILYSKNKKQKWIEELKGEVDNVISWKEFLKIQAFDIIELADKLSNYVKLSRPERWTDKLLHLLKKVISIL